MSEKEAVLARFTELFPLDFSIVSRLVVEVEKLWKGLPPETTVVVTLESGNVAERRKLLIRFEGVRDLHLKHTCSLLTLSQLTIDNISSNQWENISYRVTEEEHNTMSLFCRDFKFKLIDHCHSDYCP